jgi:hypothetical protein
VDRIRPTTVLPPVLVALLVLSTLTLGSGFGGTVGYGWTMGTGPANASGSRPFVGLCFPLLFILILPDGSYLLLRRHRIQGTAPRPIG